MSKFNPDWTIAGVYTNARKRWGEPGAGSEVGVAALAGRSLLVFKTPPLTGNTQLTFPSHAQLEDHQVGSTAWATWVFLNVGVALLNRGVLF